MKSIAREKVLRLNCPGFGEESHLNLGRAKSLDNYQVIIANPVSLLHLFDKGPEPTRRINQLLDEGVNQLNVPDDALIQELINESDSRLEELIPFLSQGGLLIYFLCRPFVLAGPTISVDNYDWLSVYAPASKSPDGTGSRQMSALSHGRVIETTDEGNTSEVFEYLEQSGIEWNTIIRTDFLSSNYSVLATAAQKKCIAAQFWAGDKGGKVIFLPAPYSPDFDRALMTCVNKWYQEAINKGFIKDDSVVPSEIAITEAPAPNSEKVPNHTMDEARLEEIMANLAANHQKQEEPAELVASAAAPAAPKQPPKGALKGLFSSDALDPFDDDDEFTSAAVLNTPEAAPIAAAAPALMTAEDILNSVSAEASRQAPASFQAMEAIELSSEAQPQASDTIATIEPVAAAPQVAMVNNFELKKATAEMDLSQFAETARQLVEQANQIETATRDPNTVSAANPKQRISDILKGLEFGGNDDNDVLEPTPVEITDVVSTPVNQSQYVMTADSTNSEALRLMESLEAGSGLINIHNAPTQPTGHSKNALTPAEIERAEIEAASRDLDSVLRPNADGADRNLFDTGRYLIADEKQPEPSAVQADAAAESAAVADRAMQEQAAKELARLEAERATRTMEEFRQTFEFLTEEDAAAREYQPESILPEIITAQTEPQPITTAPPTPTGPAALPALPEPEIFLGNPKPPVANDEEASRSTLRSLADTFGSSRLDSHVSADKPALETPAVKDEPKIDSLTTPVAAQEEPMNTSFTSFEEEQTQAAKDLAEISRLAKTIEKPATAPAPIAAPLSVPQEAQMPINNPAALAPALENSVMAPEASPSPLPTAISEPVPAAVITPPVQTAPPVEPQPMASRPTLAAAAEIATPQAAEPTLVPAQAPVPAPVQATDQAINPIPVANSQSLSAAAPVSPSTNGDGNHKAESLLSNPTAHPELPTAMEQLSTPIPPKELIKKMEEMTKTAPSTWCEEFSFPFIDLLKNEHSQMAEQIRQMQARLGAVEGRINAVETLKTILLTGENVALMSGTQEVLSRLGWQVQQSRTNINELWLSRGDQVEVIARVVHSTGGANRTEIAQLAESVIAFWDEYETEPKGILIAQTWSSKHPSERSEPDFSPALQEFASKKHLSLMSTMQLLSMYKDIELNTMPVDEMRKRMIDTSGRLLGFPLDSNVAQAASGR